MLLFEEGGFGAPSLVGSTAEVPLSAIDTKGRPQWYPLVKHSAKQAEVSVALRLERVKGDVQDRAPVPF